MLSEDTIQKYPGEELQSVSGGKVPPLPKEVEIHKVNEHSGADVNAGLPAGKIVSEADLQNVSGGLFPESFNIKPIEIQFDYTIKNIYKAE